MTETFIPHLTAPIQRTVTSAPATGTASVEQANYGTHWVPFAGDGDE
ncbi:hypothetical protein [Spongiactinospora sp. 9N601]